MQWRFWLKWTDPMFSSLQALIHHLWLDYTIDRRSVSRGYITSSYPIISPARTSFPRYGSLNVRVSTLTRYRTRTRQGIVFNHACHFLTRKFPILGCTGNLSHKAMGKGPIPQEGPTRKNYSGKMSQEGLLNNDQLRRKSISLPLPSP